MEIIQFKIRKSLKNNLEGNLSAASKKYGVDEASISAENLIPHIIWYLQLVCANNLVEKDAHLTILKNNTKIPFITSDQPIINISGEKRNELIFYYPVGPNIAITVNDHNHVKTKIYGRGEESRIDDYNRKMKQNMESVLISNEERVLRSFAKDFDEG